MSEPYAVLCKQDDPEWNDHRLTGIGASEISAVLGENPWHSRLRVWAEKTGRLEPIDLSDVEAVEMGNELEPFVARKYAERTRREVHRWAELLRSTEYDWALCTPDYYYIKDGKRIPVQVKTTSAYRVSDWVDGPPKAVWWQVQQEMMVTGASEASVAVLVGGQRFFWADVQRDESAINTLAVQGAHFWNLCIAEVAPEPDYVEDTSDVISEMYPEIEITSVPLPPEAEEWDRKLRNLKRAKKTLETRIGELETMVKLSIGAAEIGVLPNGQESYTWRLQHRKAYTVDEADFRVLRRHEKVPEPKTEGKTT